MRRLILFGILGLSIYAQPVLADQLGRYTMPDGTLVFYNYGNEKREGNGGGYDGMTSAYPSESSDICDRTKSVLACMESVGTKKFDEYREIWSKYGDQNKLSPQELAAADEKAYEYINFVQTAFQAGANIGIDHWDIDRLFARGNRYMPQLKSLLPLLSPQNIVFCYSLYVEISAGDKGLARKEDVPSYQDAYSVLQEVKNIIRNNPEAFPRGQNFAGAQILENAAKRLDPQFAEELKELEQASS